MRAVASLSFGAELLREGGVAFRLWAPAARSAAVEIERDGHDEPQHVAAFPDDDGWCRAVVADAGPGTRYRWKLDGERHVPDPASRFNPDGPHGASEVVDPAAFEWDGGWTGLPWTSSVVYELHVGTFTPEGTYEAAAERLPELAALGITVIELMPLADFPGRHGWGYDGVLLYAPHAAYGRPEALKALIQSAHRLGMAVWLDVVYNHFGPDGNYLAGYAPAFFSKRHQTAWGDGLNFDGDDAVTVREFFIQNALYWLGEYRFDGLRLDAVHAIEDDSDRHLLHELSTRVREAFPGRQVHLVLENDRVELDRLGAPGTPGRYDAHWNDDFHHAVHTLLTGEREGYYRPYHPPLDVLAQILTLGSFRGGGDAGEDGRPSAPPPAVPLTRFVNFVQNHDQIGNRPLGERLTTLADPRAVQLVMALLLLAPGVPMLFMGEEYGATTPFQYFCDWPSPLREAVRDGRAREFADFMRAHPADTLPDPCDPATAARSTLDAAEAATPNGLSQRVRVQHLLTLRREWIEPLLAGLNEPPGAPAASPGHAVRTQGDGLCLRWRFAGGAVLQLRGRFGEGSGPVPDDQGWPALEDLEPLHTVGQVAPAGNRAVDTSAAAASRGTEHRFGPWSAQWVLGREALDAPAATGPA